MDTTNENVMSAHISIKKLPVSRVRLWSGAIIGGLVVVFLIFDGVTKLLKVEASMKGSEQIGLSAESVPVIGLILLVCTAIYMIPQTRILGAILLSGYFGGAILAHVRAGNGIFPIVFSAAFGILVWLVLLLREPRLLRLILLQKWPEVPGPTQGV